MRSRRGLLFLAAYLACSTASAVAQSSPAQNTVPLFPIIKDGRWGYINRSGTISIPPQFDAAWKFSEGLAKVKIGDRFAYINPEGKIVLRAPFALTGDFHEGLAFAMVKPTPNVRDHWGYFDRTGKLVIPPSFDWTNDFSEGLGRFSLGGKQGYIDYAGKIVIAPQFQIGYEFSEGLALVFVKTTSGTKPQYKFEYIDKTGKVVLVLGMVGGSFSEGLAAAAFSKNKKVKWGYIDKSGKVVIAPHFDTAAEFSEGLAPVELGAKWGVIDRRGHMVVQPRFTGILPFSGGLAVVVVGKKYGYIDAKGKYVWKPAN